jgi:hypothetical protein
MLLVLGGASSGRAAEGDDEQQPVGDKVLVQLKLTHDGKTHEHPGYMAHVDEELVLSLTEEHAYEVSILLTKSEGKWTSTVAFRSDGKEVLSGKKQGAKPKGWHNFKSASGKSTVAIRFDPDAKRTDEVELPGGKAPLDGLK